MRTVAVRHVTPADVRSKSMSEPEPSPSVATHVPPSPFFFNDPPTTEKFVEMQQSAEFGELRSSHRSFAFPLTVGFILWYLLYVLLSNYAGGFMGTKLFGNVNVALVLGLAQFLTTFL